MLRTIILGVVTLTAGCLRDTTFRCDPTRSDQCGAGGQCESDRYCSFPSSECASGRIYGDNSGPSSNRCVGDTGPDGGNEMPGNEMPGNEMPMGNCPTTGYVPLPNSGPRGRHYKVVMTTDTWTNHKNACAAEGTWMAWPDGATLGDAQLELAALLAAAGNDAWIGINDIVSEGNYQTSLNQPASAITVMLISTMGNPNGTDCFVINNTTLDDADCNTTKKTVCECVP